MRAFNDFEKDILRFMVNHPAPQDVCTITLFTKFCGCYLIQWSDDYTTIDFAYNINENWIDVRNKIFDVIVLLQYLEANYYIGVFSANFLDENRIYDHDKYEISGVEWPNIDILEKTGKTKIRFNTRNTREYDVYSLKSKKVNHELTGAGGQIQKYANSTYHVTQSLKKFVDNDFHSQDDIKYFETKRISLIGIWVAIGIGVAPIILQLIQMISGKQ